MNGEQQPKKKRTWLWVVLGVFMFFVIVGAGGLFFAVSFFRQSMTVTDMSATSADQEFSAIRSRFAGKQPLIQMVDGRPEVVAHDDRQPASTRQLTTMHVVAWDDDDGKMMKFDIPFWLLRLKSGPFRMSAYAADLDDRGITLRVEDVERHGSGIVLDTSDMPDGRILIWTE